MVRLAAASALALVLAQSLSAAVSGEVLFQDIVQPTLKESCNGCHGVGQAISKLDLRTRAGMLAGGTRGPAVVPGKAAESLLVRALTADHMPQMPPGGPEKRLKPETIAAFRDWVNLGAPWPEAQEARKWKYEDADLWAFKPLRKAATGSTIDGFIQAKLAERGLKAAPRASKRDLIRRATLDLTGLPPSIAEIEAFEKDSSPDAWPKLVDRLLASPRYGEKWGRHWLDVTRYGDSDGFSNDFERPHAWRYRDYVIRAFNQDKPYDQFILEQIAGDELDPNSPENLIATGFLRMGPWEHTTMSVAAVTRQQWLDDVTHSVATTFMGMTFGCARCHDHKFDPIPTAEYYSMQAAFASTFFEDRKAPFQPYENLGSFGPQRDRLTRLLEWVKKQRSDYRDLAEKRTAAKLGVEKLTEALSKDARSKLLNLTPDEVEIERNYSKRQGVYERQITRFDPLAYSVKTGEPEQTFVLTGGSLQAQGAKVVPAVLSVPARYRQDLGVRLPENPEGRRLALARWIARPDNPLTARVMVNRIWHYHFGRGIAANTNNFGKMGAKPTHPELLDYLSSYFIEHGWSVKAMHRLMMLSSTYQAAAEHPDRKRVEEADPANDLRSYFPPRRLEAEELRDAILAASGELNEAAGGLPSFAEINEDVALQPIYIMGQLAPIWRPSPTRAERHRRSVYLYHKRGIPDPLLEMFNQPVSTDSCERRDATTVPMQVFALFNAQFPRDMALALAERLAHSAKTPEQQVRELFRSALRRDPREPELRAVLAHVSDREREFAARPVAAPKRQAVISREVVGESNGLRITIAEEDDPTPYEENPHASQASPRVRALASAALTLFNGNEFVYVY